MPASRRSCIRPFAALAALGAATLSLAGCSGIGGGVAPEDRLPLGEQVTWFVEDAEGNTGQLGIAVTDIVEASPSDFQYAGPDDDPVFYIMVEVTAIDGTSDALNYWVTDDVVGITDAGREASPVTLLGGGTENCPQAKRPKPFEPGSSYTQCVPVTTSGDAVVGAAYSPGAGPESDRTSTWGVPQS